MKFSLKKALYPEGKYIGKSCILVTANDGAEYDFNGIVDEIRKTSIKLIVVKVQNNTSDLIELVAGLSSIKYKVLCVFEEEDDISPFRGIRNLEMIFKVTPPNSKINKVNMSSVKLLNAFDTLKIGVNSKKQYEEAITFLQQAKPTKPEIVISVGGKASEEIIELAVDDSRFSIFNNRIINV